MISQTLVNYQSNGILVIDHLDVIVVYSKEAERFLGVPRTVALNQSIDVLPLSIKDVIRNVRQGNKQLLESGTVVESSDGTMPKLSVSIERIQNQKSEPATLILLLKDLDFLSMLEEKMRMLERLASVGTLASSMAHEVKNAIQPVTTFVETLIRKAKSSQLFVEADELSLMDLVNNELQRIKSLLANMLGFTGPNRTSVAVVKAGDVLNQTLSLVRYQMEGRQVNIKVAYETANDKIRGNAYQLEQAFLNILLNAIEATPANGQLTLQIRELTSGGKNVLEILFADTGSGIAPENYPRLFETFFTTKSTGTGLGLSITRKIVIEHGGDISIESELNAGTKVSVRLPLVA